MPDMTTQQFEFRFKHKERMLKADVTVFRDKSHRIVPDFRVYVREPAPREREHVFTYYITQDKYEPLFWFPLQNREEKDMAEAVSHALYKKQLSLDM